jgi:hypothetical protein
MPAPVAALVVQEAGGVGEIIALLTDGIVRNLDVRDVTSSGTAEGCRLRRAEFAACYSDGAAQVLRRFTERHGDEGADVVKGDELSRNIRRERAGERSGLDAGGRVDACRLCRQS